MTILSSSADSTIRVLLCFLGLLFAVAEIKVRRHKDYRELIEKTHHRFTKLMVLCIHRTHRLAMLELDGQS